MHGLIFVTWEKFLHERFGSEVFGVYREAIGETATTAPLSSRVYDDAHLLTGIGVASKLTHVPAENLLREYGRYFILNSLTSHLCTYLLNQAHSAHELLLIMRDAHAQMRLTGDTLTPPLFTYMSLSFDHHTLDFVYDSPRHLCAVLWGAIEGAASRYGEHALIQERTCMKQGASVCYFVVQFLPSPTTRSEGDNSARQRQLQERARAHQILAVLPDKMGITLAEVQQSLKQQQVPADLLRPRVLLDGLQHLQHAGIICSTANESYDDLTRRRYWCAPHLHGTTKM
jgi:hypothetical protein